MTTITLNGLVMDGTTADGDGTKWGVAKLDGWSSPQQSLALGEPTVRAGAIVLANQYRQRSITLTGVGRATSYANRDKAYAKIASLIALTSESTLTVAETVSKSLGVIRGGPTLVEAQGLTVLFSLSLIALNPFKRGASHTSSFTAGQTKTIAYAGTVPGFPTITTTGSGTVNLANSTTATTIITSSVASGTVIDTYARTVYSGTTNTFDAVQPGVLWPTLQPGNNTVTNGGTAPITLAWYDLYL